MNLDVPFHPQPKAKALRLKADRERKMRIARDIVWARDKVCGAKGYETAPCHFCGRFCERGERQAEVHHLQKRSTHPELRYDPTNLVIACLGCHRKEHQ